VHRPPDNGPGRIDNDAGHNAKPPGITLALTPISPDTGIAYLKLLVPNILGEFIFRNDADGRPSFAVMVCHYARLGSTI
jgi:hypothetical protein